MRKTLSARLVVIGWGALLAFAALTSFHGISLAQTADREEQENDGQAITLEQAPEAPRSAIKKAAGSSALTVKPTEPVC